MMSPTSHPGDGERSEDLEAMTRLARGEDLALNELMDRWRERVIAFLLRLTGSETAAVDLAQETFVRLYQTRTRFRSGTSGRSFSSWLFGIAANLARMHLRWRGRHPTLSLEEAPDPGTEENPGVNAELHEREAAVRDAVSALPPDLRETLILSVYEGLSHSEIAAAANCSVKAVERRLSRAREILRKELSRHLRNS